MRDFCWCWVCGEAEEVFEEEVSNGCTIWLCSKHLGMHERAEERLREKMKREEISEWRKWERASARPR